MLVNKHTLLKREEFPVINGVSIRSIFPYKFQHNGSTHIFSGAPDYWILYPLKHGDRKIKVRRLPEPFCSILGEGNMSTHMSYRGDNSHNGSFTDETLSVTLNGKYLNYYRAEPYMDKYESTIKANSALGKLVISTIGMNMEIEEMEWFEGVKFDQTYLQRVDGKLYPDAAQESWRWLYGFPYVSNDYPDRKHIRVYNRDLNLHYYLERVEPEKGMTNLVIVNFPYSSHKRPWEFCNPLSWAFTKEEAPYEFIRWNIVHIKRDGSIQVAAMIGDDVQFKQWRSGYFYRVNRVIG